MCWFFFATVYDGNCQATLLKSFSLHQFESTVHPKTEPNSKL